MTIQDQRKALEEDIRRRLDRFYADTGLVVPYMQVQYLDVSSLEGKNYLANKVDLALATEPPGEDG